MVEQNNNIRNETNGDNQQSSKISALLKIVILLAVLLTTIAFFLGNRPCEIESSKFYLETDTLREEILFSNNRPYYEVPINNLILVTSEISLKQSSCTDPPYITWDVLSDNALFQVELSGTPTNETLTIMAKQAIAETLVTIQIRDGNGAIVTTHVLPLKVNGD